MSKRDFGNIKCLLHFDYPYYNEPHDGLGDETGNTEFSMYKKAKLAGNIIPYAVKAEPKFGYRCAYIPDATSYIENSVEFDPESNDNIFRLNSSNDYEFECFLRSKISTNDERNVLFGLWSRDENNSDIEILSLSFKVKYSLLNEDDNERAFDIENYDTIFHLASDIWGIDETFTVSTGPLYWNEDDENAYNSAQAAYDALPFVDKWSHVLLRISGNKASVFLDSVKVGECNLPSNVYLNTTFINLGGFADSGYIDEFVFRHEAGSDNPTIPTKPYSAILDVDNIGGYGNGAEGVVNVSANVSINSYGIISSITDTRTLTVRSWTNCNSNYPQGLPDVGKEVMIHITAPKSTTSAAYPLVGLYEFARIAEIDGNTIVLDHDINSEFTLDSSLLSTYYVQVIIVPNYFSFSIDAGKTVSPSSWSTTKGGGIVAFRCKSTCNINGSIISYGKGAIRYDLHQMTHSKLLDRFLCAKGGGIFIACGGTFFCSSDSRLGATWSGEGDGNNGAAGYGGNGGKAVSAKGLGGVGGGGGGSGRISNNTNTGGNVGKNGNGTLSYAVVGGGGGGCGGNGGNSSRKNNAGGGGGGQGGSGGTFGVTSSNESGTKANINGSGNSEYYCSGGGGAPGGNGGMGTDSTSSNYTGGYAGACIILIVNHLNVFPQNISTGGGVGESNPGTIGGTGGGGGTGFCYIAAKRQV